jgi:hypothetical protein
MMTHSRYSGNSAFIDSSALRPSHVLANLRKPNAGSLGGAIFTFWAETTQPNSKK